MNGPRIYVASLSDYNNGELHGVWLDLADLPDEVSVYAEVQRMLADSAYGPAEEWAIHDFEGFAGWEPHEYESLETVAKVAQAIIEHGEAVAKWIANIGDVSAVDSFEEAYIGECSALDYAYEYIDSTGVLDGMPESLRSYFDYEEFARDMLLGGDVTEIDGHLFRGHIG